MCVVAGDTESAVKAFSNNGQARILRVIKALVGELSFQGATSGPDALGPVSKQETESEAPFLHGFIVIVVILICPDCLTGLCRYLVGTH